MAISGASALRRLCEIRDWSISNLEANKLLYFAHMLSLGESDGDNPMVRERFEAWDYGPVLPSVYQRARMFGDNSIKAFALSDATKTTDYDGVLYNVSNQFAHYSGSKLIAESHWPYGAWSECYRAGAKGVDIPNDAILAEYRKRQASTAASIRSSTS